MSKDRVDAKGRAQKKRQWLAKFAWVILAALFIVGGSACGGGGGGSSSGTNATTSTNATTTGTFTETHIAGSLASNSSQGIDPADVVAGTQVQLQVLALNSSGQWVTETASNWSTTAPSGVATVSSGGLLTANAPGGPYTISCNGPQGALSAPLDVQPASQPTVTGLVQDRNGLGITQVYVYFYNSAGTQVGESITGSNGTFDASVPSTATGFTLNITVADPLVDGTSIFYRQFEYGPPSNILEYLEQDTGCLAPLPPLKSSAIALPYTIVLDDRASGPPPPPTGCG